MPRAGVKARAGGEIRAGRVPRQFVRPSSEPLTLSRTLAPAEDEAVKKRNWIWDRCQIVGTDEANSSGNAVCVRTMHVETQGHKQHTSGVPWRHGRTIPLGRILLRSQHLSLEPLHFLLRLPLRLRHS